MSEPTLILEDTLPGERKRLVRLCARLTGDADSAEDLAQETLLEAWRQINKLHDPAGYAPWLSAIARNVCLRWRQRHGREASRLTRSGQDGEALDLLEAQPDTFDLELELERNELATLLDRALALLPAETRSVLIARYVDQTPLAEVAARLGMTDSGLKARLHRGKLTLRRVLLRDFADDAAAYGLIEDDRPMGQETRIWCSECGQARLRGIFDRDTGTLSLGCPHCSPGEIAGSSWMSLPEVFKGVSGFRAAYSRQSVWLHEYMSGALDGQVMACVYCGGPAALCMGPPIEARQHGRRRGVHVRCARCQLPMWSSLGSLALNHPECRRFWRRHPRLAALPERQIEVDGTAAIVKSYQERGRDAHLDIVFASSTLQVIRITCTPNVAD